MRYISPYGSTEPIADLRREPAPQHATPTGPRWYGWLSRIILACCAVTAAVSAVHMAQARSAWKDALLSIPLRDDVRIEGKLENSPLISIAGMPMRPFFIEAFSSPDDAAGAWGDFAKQELPAQCEVLVSLPYSKAGDEHLRLIAQGPRVRSLALDGTQITDAGLTHLRAMSYLKILSLGGTGISDAGARVLADVRSLRYLDLRQTRLSNASLASLGALAQLESLDLSGTDVDGAGLMHLAKLPKLQTLVLNDVAVGDGDVAVLLAISSLRELHLRGTCITESGVAQLAAGLPLRVCEFDGGRLPLRNPDALHDL